MAHENQNDESRFKLLIDAVTDYAIYMLDPHGVITSWNLGAERFKGYQAEDVIGTHFSRFYTEEDREKGLPEIGLAKAKSEGRYETEGWRIRKDGTRYWAHVIIDPIYTSDNEFIGFAKIARDQTERKLAEEKLRHSEEQLRFLVQSVTDYALYMLDLEGRITTWNIGAQRIKGYSPDEIIGQHFSVFYTDEDKETDLPRRALESAKIDGRMEHEGWRIRKDGSRFWASVVLDPVKNDSGEHIGYAKITRDITERRESQIALEKAQQIIVQQQKLDAIGQLTGGIAHDFNNLLMAIMSSVSLAKKNITDDKTQRFLDNALQAGERGATLTKRMLAFARRQDLKPSDIDVSDLVRGMTDLIQRSLGPEYELTTKFSLALPKLRSDVNQIELALLNLVVNARDAMPAGGAISIEAGDQYLPRDNPHGLREGRYICISVVDEGEGMDEETLSRASEPFFTTKGVGKGTGLGLSMVHGVAQQSGGCLHLKSKLGEGTRATICLPASSASLRIQEMLKVTKPSPLPTLTKRLKVLVVDDDALVRINTVAMMEDLDHSVDEADSAQEALRLLRVANYDLVITDQAMPTLTGLQLIEQIEQEWPSLKVILATGYSELPAGTKTPHMKLSKPFTEDELSHAVSKVMKTAR